MSEGRQGLRLHRLQERQPEPSHPNDLVQHPPISRIDLLVCRNTLMYFTAEMQRRVLGNFHFAVAENGFLFLGKSEAMARRTDLFEIVNLKQRIFRRNGRSAAPLSPVPGLRTPKRGAIHADDPAAVLAAAFEESAVAQMLVDPEGLVTAVNRHARALFGLGADAAGRPLKDLQISYRPIELRSLVDEAVTHRRPIVVHDVEWTAPTGEVEYFDVALQPLGADNNGGVAVTCTQVGRYKLLRDELERSQRELESAYEELQSTVEELETTNEELHSTNEELETMNEELQSMNEELETANGELRDRSLALDEANSFLESILGSLRSGFVVLNRDMAVRAWNRTAEDMWGLGADEVEGSHFLNLDIGLPVDQLRSPVSDVLAGGSDGEVVTLAAVNGRGRAIECTVNIAPLRDGNAVIGAILVMDA